MRKEFVVTLFTFLFLASSCKKVDAGKGEPTDHLIAVSAFNRIVLETGGKLTYTEDSTDQYFNIRTTSEVMEILDIRVEDSTLIIGIQKGYTIKNSDEILMTINSPLCKDYIVSGNGDIEIHRTTSDTLPRCELIISGSGNIDVNQMHALELFNLISGSGNMYLQNIHSSSTANIISGSGDFALYGDCYSNYIQVSGTGNINSYSFNTIHSEVKISGSASARVRVDSTLNVEINGYGNVFYKGYPTVTTNISGDGDVINAN